MLLRVQFLKIVFYTIIIGKEMTRYVTLNLAFRKVIFTYNFPTYNPLKKNVLKCITYEDKLPIHNTNTKVETKRKI